MLVICWDGMVGLLRILGEILARKLVIFCEVVPTVLICGIIDNYFHFYCFYFAQKLILFFINSSSVQVVLTFTFGRQHPLSKCAVVIFTVFITTFYISLHKRVSTTLIFCPWSSSLISLLFLLSFSISISLFTSFSLSIPIFSLSIPIFIIFFPQSSTSMTSILQCLDIFLQKFVLFTKTNILLLKVFVIVTGNEFFLLWDVYITKWNSAWIRLSYCWGAKSWILIFKILSWNWSLTATVLGL